MTRTPRERGGGARAPRPAGGRIAGDADWTPERAETIARAAGIGVLLDRHWRVITLCREEAARTGRRPGLQELERLTGLLEEELRRLFPGDPAVSIGRIAGLNEPSAAHRGRDAAGPQKE